MWNFDIYLYDLRILRYISELEAIIFNGFYILMAGTVLDLIFNGRLGIGSVEVDSSNFIDMLIAIILGYLLIEFFPTAYLNSAILVKELTLNPFAWRKKQDYHEAMLFNEVNVDLLYLLGINEDVNYYLEYFAKQGRMFL